MMTFALSGWSGDACTPSTFSQNPLSILIPYTKSDSVGDATPDNFYFKAPAQSGTVDVYFTARQTADIYFSSSTTVCPSATGSLTTATFHVAADEDFNVKVFRNSGNAAIKTYSIKVSFSPDVVTTPPTMNNIPDNTFTVGTPFSLDLSAYVTRTDGDPILSYALTGTLPTGLSFVTATGILSGTPTAGGTFSLSATATDKDGISNSKSFSLTNTVVAGPPVMGNIPNQDIYNGVAYTLHLADYASTPGNAITSYHITGTLPTGLSFTSATGVLTGTPTVNGDYNLSAYATNINGNSNSDDFNITVSTIGVPSNLIIVKAPSVRFADVNQTVRYIITIANETSTTMSDVNITDTLTSYNYDLGTGTRGTQISPALDLNITIVSSSLNCGTVLHNASSFTCTGTVPKRTGQSGVPGLARITYTITTPVAPVPAELYNNVTINGTTTHDSASVIVSTGGNGGTILTPPPEHADVIDTDMWSTVANYNAGISKVLKTKISAQTPVSLTAVHLNGGGVATDFNSSQNLPFLVMPYISNGMCSTQEILHDTAGNPALFSILHGEVTDTINVIMPAYAQKDSRISISFLDLNQLYADTGESCLLNSSTTGNLAGLGQCVNSANKYYDAFGLSAYERCQVMNGEPCNSNHHGKSCNGDTTCPNYNALYDNDYGCLMCTMNAFPDCSSDNFAIRPEKIVVTSANTDMPNLLRSAQDYNTTLHAYNYSSTTNTTSYDITNANSIFIVTSKMYDINDIERNSTTTPAMVGIAAWSLSAFDMFNGISLKSGVNEVAGIKFDDVGKIDFHIEDQNWSAVDNDDTPMNCDANGTFVCGDINVTFIPHHFDFNTSRITNNNGNPGTYTYIANEVGQMAARIDTTMRALNKDGNVTLNFATSPLWENNVTAIPTVIKSTYLYPDANETNITNLPIGFTSGAKYIGWNETNTSTYLRFNFKRDVNQSVNPFDVNGSDLNITISSHYVDATTGHIADVNGSRLGTGVNNLPYTIVLPADGNSTMIYGRTHAPRYRFATPVGAAGNPGSAFIYYEAFCNGTDIGGVTCSKDLLPGGPDLNSSDDPRWFKNVSHVAPTYGEVGNVTQKGFTVSTELVSAGALNNSVAGQTMAPLTYDASKGYPYKTTMENNASGWLIYNQYLPAATKNEFEVEFDSNSSAWAGKRDTNTTTQRTGADRTNRRTMW